MRGGFTGTVPLPTRTVTGIYTLRIRTTDAVTVEVWRQSGARWSLTSYAGRDVQALLPPFHGEALRLVVIGTASGVVEVV